VLTWLFGASGRIGRRLRDATVCGIEKRRAF
jgi:hypothetical protein